MRGRDGGAICMEAVAEALVCTSAGDRLNQSFIERGDSMPPLLTDATCSPPKSSSLALSQQSFFSSLFSMLLLILKVDSGNRRLMIIIRCSRLEGLRFRKNILVTSSSPAAPRLRQQHFDSLARASLSDGRKKPQHDLHVITGRMQVHTS